ncbi:hypothetical protein [Agromyces subbeticus]|uniref:hypothetical protein n=1 Tax=Agromyces subbeticus TaxID=293890 RepID=UPI0003B6C953|nr:hypothetical protein [Agromyces subbeticus]
MSIAFWVCAAITAVSALVSLGYSVAGVRGTKGGELTASRYALARSAALAVGALASVFTASVPFTAAMAVTMMLVQAADAAVGVTIRDHLKTVGPAATAIANAAALIWMLSVG